MDIIDLIENKKIERYFSVKHKLIFADNFYHVTQRAPGTEKLFIEDDDYLYFLHLLKENLSRFNIDLHAFALMPNHIHALTYLHKANLSPAMQKVLQRYAIYFNNKYKRKGHVFCGGYGCALCNSERYILAVSLYIHLNPYKAGLVSRIDDYRWSSVRLYLKPGRKSFVKTDFILSLLDSDQNEACKMYRRLLRECGKVRHTPLSDNMRGLDRIYKKVGKFYDIHSPDRRLNKEADIEQEDILRFDNYIRKLRGKKRLRQSTDKQAFMYLVTQLKSRGFRVKEIADILDVSRFKIRRLCNISVPD